MRRNRESSITISKKKKILTFDERKKILHKICIFGSRTSSITTRYNAADFLHTEFSLKNMPLSILMKTLHSISTIYLQQKSFDRWLIWPATKILHGIIMLQKNSKVLNVIIGDLIPIICNSLLFKIEIPSPEFEMFITFISCFCIKNSAARHKIRTTSFPSTFIDLLGKKQISINEFTHAGTLLSIMEEHDEEFDNLVTDQEMLFTVFDDLFNPANDPMVLKTAFLIFTFYFSRDIPERIEKLIEHNQIISNVFDFLTFPLLTEETRLAALRSILYILTSQNPKLPGIFLENGFVKKFSLAWNYLSRQDQIWYLSGFMEFSNEIKYAFLEDDKIISNVIIGCYCYKYKHAKASLSCILRLLSTLPEPLRTDFALCGAHDAVQFNVQRLPLNNISIETLSTDSIYAIMTQYLQDI